MAYPDHLLSRDEQVEMRKHPHWKVLVLPIIALILVVGGGFALGTWLRNWEYHVILWWVLVAVGVVLLVWWVVAPLVRRYTEYFVVTNHHVFFRSGVIHRRQHQIPLSHIQNLETQQTLWGRMLNYGTLVVESAADQPLEFTNVASLAKVQAKLNQLIRDDRDPRRRHLADPPADDSRTTVVDRPDEER